MSRACLGTRRFVTFPSIKQEGIPGSVVGEGIASNERNRLSCRRQSRVNQFWLGAWLFEIAIYRRRDLRHLTRIWQASRWEHECEDTHDECERRNQY